MDSRLTRETSFWSYQYFNRFSYFFVSFQAKLLQNSQAWLNAAAPSSSLNSMSGNTMIMIHHFVIIWPISTH